jgi:SAM-dependent methyltransferase
MSTMSLHHLPSLEHLAKTFSEISRVLKPGGGLYLADFTHLKSEKSIHYFAHQHEERQPRLFTIDYLNSLRAAFYLQDLQRLVTQHLAKYGELHAMSPMPFMMAIKSPQRDAGNERLRGELQAICQGLPPLQRTDFEDMRRLFKFGGLRSTLLS